MTLLRKKQSRNTGTATTASVAPTSDSEAAPDAMTVNTRENATSTQRHVRCESGGRDNHFSRSTYREAQAPESAWGAFRDRGTNNDTNRKKGEYTQHGRSVVLGSAVVLIKGTEVQKRDYIAGLRRGDNTMTVDQFNELVTTLCRIRRLREALVLTHLWEQEPFASTLRSSRAIKSYTIMIDIYGKSHQLARAFSLFYGMSRVGVQPNVITYNAMISACARNNEPDLAYEVFEDMQESGLRPDKFTYGSLIDSCAKSGQVERAFQISRLMDTNRVMKDQTIYSALMDACGRAKQLERAFLVFEEMKRNAVWPNLVTFSVLIDTCVNARQPQRAFQLFSEIKHWGFPRANVVVYTALIDACSKAGWPKRAELVMSSMIENGIRPNEISFGALMDGWTREGQINQAFQILDRMVRQHRVLPNAVLMGSLIDACRRLKETSRAKAIWAVVIKYNIRPSRTYYPALIAMAARNGDIDVASAIALHAYARGSLRRVTLNSENPALHALACAIAYLKYVIDSDISCSAAVKKQHLDRLRVVFSSTAMGPDQMKQLSPDAAYDCCISWNNIASKNAPSAGQVRTSCRAKLTTPRRLSGQAVSTKRTKKAYSTLKPVRTDQKS